MFILERSLPTSQYKSDSIRTKFVKPVPMPSSSTLSFGPIDLCMAYGKSLFTRDPTWVEFAEESFEALVRMQRLVVSRMPGQSSNLRLFDGFRDRYRDFSKSSRTGEFAQAVSFLFAQEILNCPVVMDFRGYLQSIGAPVPGHNTRAPDYVGLFSAGTTNTILIESKGSSPTRARAPFKGDLKEALAQCDAGQRWMTTNGLPLPLASYGVLVHFAEKSDGRDSQIHWCDPEMGIRQAGLADDARALRRYYAAYSSWLDRFDITNAILETHAELPGQLEIRKYRNQSFYILSSTYLDRWRGWSPFFSWLNRFPSRIVNRIDFGISFDILNGIVSGKGTDQIVRLFKTNAFADEKKLQEGERAPDFPAARVFRDGTIYFTSPFKQS